MESKTKGIIVRLIKQGESSGVLTIYTEHFGLMGFHLPGLFKNKGKIKLAHCQLLNLVEISFEYKKNKQLQKLTDLHCVSACVGLNFTQTALQQVVVELLQQCVKADEINSGLFQYLYAEGIPSLNTDIHFWQLPHLLLSFLYHYGCAPNTEQFESGACLDLINGTFTLLPLSKSNSADPNVSLTIHSILTQGIQHLDSDKVLRHQVIMSLNKYIQLHVQPFFELKSFDVLAQVAAAN